MFETKMEKTVGMGTESQHGDDYKGELRANFSSNVWFGANHTGLYTHLSNRMAQICRYPEEHSAALRNRLARNMGISSEELWLCNGSVEGIYLLAQAYSGSRSLIVSPAFSEYARACQTSNHEVGFCKAHELSDMLENIRPDLVWLCTPNNPDGYSHGIAFLEELVSKFPATVFIFDISFKEFCLAAQPDSQWPQRFKNVVLVYSFTKRYGIPGLRLGYIQSVPEIIQKVGQFAIPWSVNALAAEALLFILGNYTDDFDIGKWLVQKDDFCREINRIDGFGCIESTTPFFLVKLHKGSSAHLKQYLLERGILVRDAANFFDDGGQYIRLLTLTVDKNTILIHELRKWQQQLSE